MESYADLSKAPLGERRYFRKKYVFDTVYASAGAASTATSASVPYLFGKTVRFRPVDDVVREIDSLGHSTT